MLLPGYRLDFEVNEIVIRTPRYAQLVSRLRLAHGSFGLLLSSLQEGCAASLVDVLEPRGASPLVQADAQIS